MSPADNEIPPIAAPMSTPEPKMGSKEAAMINIGMAMDLLEQSLPALGSDSAEVKSTNYSSLKFFRCSNLSLKLVVQRLKGKL
jgi:hypothetical protein